MAGEFEDTDIGTAYYRLTDLMSDMIEIKVMIRAITQSQVLCYKSNRIVASIRALQDDINDLDKYGEDYLKEY